MKRSVALILSLVLLMPLLSGCGKPVNNGFDESQIVLQFAAISDLQHGRSANNTELCAKEAYKQLQNLALQYSKNGLDAVFFAGDLIQNATTAQTKEFKKLYEDVFDPSEVPLIFCLGNHDVKATASQKEELTFESYYAIFGDRYRAYEKDSDLSIGCVHQKVGKYHFLAINPLDSGYSEHIDGSVPYAQETKDWLDARLAEITRKEPDKYVFIATHPLIYGTTYGSELIYDDFGWFTTELTEILSKYPQAMVFGGHMHFSINDDRSIMQTDFTSLQCGSITYMGIEDGGYKYMKNPTNMSDCNNTRNGYLVQVDKLGNVRVIRINFGFKGLIKEPFELLAPQADGSHLLAYTAERGEAPQNAAPVFPADAIWVEDDAATVADGQALTVKLHFKAATDDDQVHYYAVTITDENGEEVERFKLASDFYKVLQVADMDKEWKTNLKNSTYYKGHSYTIALTAYDDWDTASETVVYTYQP